MRCLSGHGSEDILARHMVYCKDHKIARAILPKEGDKLRFSNHHNQLKRPYIICADCEALIEPLEQPIQAGNNTIRDSQHQVCSVAYIVIRSDGTNVKSQLHSGKLPLSSLLSSSWYFRSASSDTGEIAFHEERKPIQRTQLCYCLNVYSGTRLRVSSKTLPIFTKK